MGQAASGSTPLHHAVRLGNRDLVQRLIAGEPNVNASIRTGQRGRPDSEWQGQTPIQLAAAGGFYEIAELLIEAGAAADARDAYGTTPLHEAVSRGRRELPKGRFKDVAELLLARDADVNARDEQGQTPLHAAVAWTGPSTRWPC
jgi:ankyrin repeat protein